MWYGWRIWGKAERDKAFMSAKTRAENAAEGEVRGSAQMVSCQRPAVRTCVRGAYTVHVCGYYMSLECVSALAFLCTSMHVCVCRCPLCRGEVLYVRRAVQPRWCWQTDTARLAELARVPGAQLALPATMLSPMYWGGGTCCHPPKQSLTIKWLFPLVNFLIFFLDLFNTMPPKDEHDMQKDCLIFFLK